MTGPGTGSTAGVDPAALAPAAPDAIALDPSALDPDPTDATVTALDPGRYPSVAEVLDLPPLQAGRPRVVAGERGLGGAVRWTHVSEVVDVARLLRGGELLFTTGIALPERGEDVARWVRELADVGAAGVCVELGRRYERLPPSMVRAAEEAGLPLVELAQECRFVEITERVHGLIVAAQVARLRASEVLHQTFTELSVEGASASEIVRQTSRMAGRPVVLENLSHQVLAFDTSGRDPDVVLGDWEARSRGVASAGRTGYDDRAGWLVTTVGARGSDWGRLVLLAGATPSAQDLMLVERAAAALALGRLVERDRESLERQTHRLLLQGLLTHSLPEAETALRARALGVPLEGRTLLAVVLRLHDGRQQATEPRTRPLLEAQARLRDFAETAALAIRDAGLLGLVGVVDDAGVGVLLSLPRRGDVESELDQFAAALNRRARASRWSGSGTASAGTGGQAAGHLVAVGSAVATVGEARRSFLEAAQVADAAELGPGVVAPPYYRLPDVRLRGLLHLLRDDERLQTYTERELGPLLAHDSARGTDLVGMLRAYLAHGRNKSAAADAVHLSRPAFYDRLDRVEQVLHVDLDDVESCLSLHVALLALDALRRPGSTEQRG